MSDETVESAELQPAVLQWARKRANLSQELLAQKLELPPERIKEWEATGRIAFNEIERLAEKTFTQIGFLFLKEPPEDALPISDFRRVGGGPSQPPSPDLLDVLHSAQRRQSWYRDYIVSSGEPPLGFVGKATLQTPFLETASDIRDTLHIGPALTSGTDNWEEALRLTIEALEDAGILVLRTGFAGGYTHRKLAVEEFRGFALADAYAPLIFINGADAPSAQMFTLAHELVHIWLGESAVSNLHETYSARTGIEVYCNQVAAEILVPTDAIKLSWKGYRGRTSEIARLAKKYAVSQIVVARRARDVGFLTPEEYSRFFALQMKASERSKGGNYYLNSQYQNSRRFSVALLLDTRAGRTLYHDAMQLLGMKKDLTFRRYAESLKIEW